MNNDYDKQLPSTGETFAEGFGAILILAFWAACLGGWITHIIFCLSHNRWGFLIAGALAFPIAIIHGWLIWLGVVS